jgi:hypothetical protein
MKVYRNAMNMTIWNVIKQSSMKLPAVVESFSIPNGTGIRSDGQP